MAGQKWRGIATAVAAFAAAAVMALPGATVAAATIADDGPSPQVVGGSPVPQSWGAFTARIEQARTGDLVCSAVKVAEDVVLTGAHCVTPLPPGDAGARKAAVFGAPRVAAWPGSRVTWIGDRQVVVDPIDPATIQVRLGASATGGTVVGVRGVVTAVFGWGATDAKGRVNDAALVFLSRGRGSWIGTGRVPDPGTVVTGAGFGYTVPGEELPAWMQRFTATVFPPSSCALGGLGTDELCTRTTTAHGTPCYGDSGGPLGLTSPLGGLSAFRVVGTTSRGVAEDGTCAPGLTIFMAVAAHWGWMKLAVFDPRVRAALDL